MPFTLPSLPYAYDALEPHIDARTMEIHHTKHHATYIEKLNAALADQNDLLNQPIEALLSDLAAIPEAVRLAVRNHGGGHYNHSFFWPLMSPDGGGEPTGALQKALTQTFGDVAAFRQQFEKAATGHFGSGWAWLVRDKNQALSIITTPNQDTPLSQGLMPVLGIDVWEHAYYLKYQNKRPDYVAAWWNVVNWEQAQENYAA